MKQDHHHPPPPPLDFSITPGIRSAAQFTVPAAVYTKYRDRVLTDLKLRKTDHLLEFMGLLMAEPEFPAAYFHPTPEVLRWGGGGDGRGQSTLYSDPDAVKLDGWAYELAMRHAHRVSQCPELSGSDQDLARVAAFIYPSGLLRMWDIVRRGGGDPHNYADTAYGGNHNRYLRGVLVHTVLKQFALHNPIPGQVLGCVLDERWKPWSYLPDIQARVARVGAGVISSQIGLRQDLKNHPSVRP